MSLIEDIANKQSVYLLLKLLAEAKAKYRYIVITHVRAKGDTKDGEGNNPTKVVIELFNFCSLLRARVLSYNKNQLLNIYERVPRKCIFHYLSARESNVVSLRNNLQIVSPICRRLQSTFVFYIENETQNW